MIQARAVEGRYRRLRWWADAALIATAEPDEGGLIVPRLPEREGRLTVTGSGLYAAVTAAGKLYWRSPSAEGSVEDFGPALQPGPPTFRYLTDTRGRRLAAVSRGLQWEDIGELTFTVAEDMTSYNAQLASFRKGLAGGFTVVAPDLYSGRFIDKMPVRHDPALEDDAALAIDFALGLPEARGQAKTCVVSHTRGGYYALKALVTKGRQAKVACYVSYYPLWQHPEAPEAMQVYQYAPEVDALAVPVLVFVGEHEQYQRTRPIVTAIDSLQKKNRYALLVVYPVVGRGFDFRPREVRTLADDMAAQDSLVRAAALMRRTLAR